MQIGELSRRCGVSVRMLRYYESRGLLRPERTVQGYRIFGDADVDVVRRITTLNAAGLRLETIRRILPCTRPDSPGLRPCDEFKDSVRQALAELDSQIAALSESRRLLAAFELKDRG